jgi:glycosyltransferase involved in cell wall biosynthesis
MRMNKKKILILSPIFPCPLKSGGQVRIFNIIKHLSDSFDISLLSPVGSKKEEYVSEILQFCRTVETIPAKIYENHFDKMVSFLKPSQLPRTVRRFSKWLSGIPFQICRFYHSEMVGKLERMIAKDKYDIVYAVYSQMAPYLTLAKVLDRNIKTILEDIDLSFITKYREYENKKGMARIFASFEYKRIKDYVAKTWPSYDKIIVMSDVDKEKLSTISKGMNISVVPNGVDTEYFQPVSHRKSNNNKLAFLGGSLHYPNVDALMYFCKEIYPQVCQDIKDISLTVIGEFTENSILKTNNSVRFTGYVDDIRPYLNDCTLLIVPIRIGGGTRLKILEAMSLGIPVVSTSIGCEGIDAEKDKDIIIADSPHDFAKSIKAVLKDESFRHSLSRNGRHLVKKKYNWENITSRLEKIYQNELTPKV